MPHYFSKKKSKSIKSRGFTLIEMMVAVSIFVIVAFIVVSTLLTMSYAYKKAQKMRLVMDNFNFALQSISLNIREGVKYDISSCSSGSCFELEPIDSWLAGENSKICYYLYRANFSGVNRGVIKKCDGACSSCISSQRGSRLTSSSDINVENLVFKINEDNSPSLDKNKVKIMIQGVAGTVPREQSSFFIQTTVSQRNINL